MQSLPIKWDFKYSLTIISASRENINAKKTDDFARMKITIIVQTVARATMPILAPIIIFFMLSGLKGGSFFYSFYGFPSYIITMI